ncbi:hypothetical protein HK103_003122 [Boothiomyces macroporosus]|uniref:WD40 repeat-containing protein SMU1 n=1 Tax=Boothiomyces macroporosus TaxID=261099 RepID=A0AAD5UKQ6_9FUNG|nr:hypothetical protein HK103_003122 [Boothiomyces macroporosus]
MTKTESEELLKIANSNVKHEWDLNKITQPSQELFNAKDGRIKQDILRLIIQYLQDEGYYACTMTIMDEANLKQAERLEQQSEIKRMKKAILDGDWAEVDKLCARPFMRNHKSFLYAAYEQQFLEYIDHHEIQKAFTHLNKRLKPLEHLQRTPNEFRDLCYLLTSKSVQDVHSYKNWEGITSSREKLAEMFQNMIDYDVAEREGSAHVPPKRLLTLLQQAVAYQVEYARYHPNVTPKITSLLQDFNSLIIPNAVKSTFLGHTSNVKCAEFLGEDGSKIISGILEGHTSRIWDISCRPDGKFVASGSGDSTVKLWDVKNIGAPCVSTLLGHSGDDYLATGGYDKIVRLYDVERETITKAFSGHTLSVSKSIFTPLGNLIISGSYDNSIKFWDIVSGLCIKTISTHLGEVTNVEMSSDGYYLLSSSKDNSNRLWDIRMVPFTYRSSEQFENSKVTKIHQRISFEHPLRANRLLLGALK